VAKDPPFSSLFNSLANRRSYAWDTLEELPKSIKKGIGNTLGGLTIIIFLGAMFGKLVSESGAALKKYIKY
jgi:H+/gluconate symporter-like permease